LGHALFFLRNFWHDYIRIPIEFQSKEETCSKAVAFILFNFVHFPTQKIYKVMTIGFIGLGNLGTVMVNNLIEKNIPLHLYNRTQEKMKAFSNGAQPHASLSSLAEACDLIISIVSNDKAVEAISYGSKGLIAQMKPGSVHVCLSTIAPSTASMLEEANKEKGIDYCTATIIGRPEAARIRNLVACYSSSTSHKTEVFTILQDLGVARIFEFGGKASTAAAVKVCNNFLMIAAMEAMGEAFNLIERAGGSATDFYEMISNSVFSCPIYKNYGKIIVEKNYKQPGFTSQLGLKDTRLALQLADETNTPLPLADLVKNRFLVNHNRGRIGWDWASFVEVIREENK
jgi:3-hydroxyisobutyrate dehydrogenase-like beta-hydroxyacid dehydrogenase